jgi:hypothetical protein
MAKRTPARSNSRAGLIQTVQTPLGFFTLVVLIVEAILGATAGLAKAPAQSLLISAMIILIFALVIIVSLFAYYRPGALQGVREEPLPRIDAGSGAPAVQLFPKPKILCAASEQFEKLGFDQDISAIDSSFPRCSVVIRGLSCDALRKALTEKEYQIIHLSTLVDLQNGALIFSQQDQITAEGFAKLIEFSQTGLVVLASCESVVLAAKISRVANMIAATSSMTVEEFVQWEECFYALLSRGQSLSRSFDIARATTVAPMVLLMKQDIAFSA